MKAEKLPSGKYRVRVWDKSKQKQVSFISAQKKDAERKAMEYALSMGNVPDVTFEEAVEIYLSTRDKLLSPSTIASYRMYQRNYYGRLNGLKLDRISDLVLQAWVNDLSEKRSAKTVLNIYSHTTAILRVFDPKFNPNVTLPTITKPKIKPPNQAEIRILSQGLRNTPLYVPFVLAAFGCMRRGEIMALREEDIDYREGTIRIHRDIVLDSQRNWVMKSTKTGEERTIHPPKIVMQAVREKGLPYHYIDNPDRITVEFGRYLRRNNLEPIRFHDLRHFCAARMLSSGVDIPISVVQEYGGWKTEKVLLSIYNYVIDEVRVRAMDAWDSETEKMML